MKNLVRFIEFPFFIQIIWISCVLGTILNVILLWRDMTRGSVLWHLHTCFLLLYSAQVIFIWLKEPLTAVLTAVQGVVALLSTSDFIFYPFLKGLGIVWAGFFDPTVHTLRTYEYIFVSLAFTLQMTAAFYLWASFRRPKKDKPEEQPVEQ